MVPNNTTNNNFTLLEVFASLYIYCVHVFSGQPSYMLYFLQTTPTPDTSTEEDP